MNKSSCELTLNEFFSQMSWYIDFLKRIQKTRHVVKLRFEKEEVFEAFVFKISAIWEVFYQDLLIDCFSKDTSMFKNTTDFKIPKHLSLETCKAIIFGTGYLDIKSVGDLKKQSQRILMPSYNPFVKIPSTNAEKINEFFSIKNYLSHYSDLAKRKLDNIYKKKYNLHKFIEPGQFLLSIDRKSKLPRMAVYVNNFVECVYEMAKFLGITIK